MPVLVRLQTTLKDIFSTYIHTQKQENTNKKKRPHVTEIKKSIAEINDSMTNDASSSQLWIENGAYESPKIQFQLEEIKQWPSKTNIKCWNCTRNFDTVPIGIPYKIHNNIYYVKGCFCSFPCAYTYNHYYEEENKWNQESLLYKLFRDCGYFGKMNYAPPKEILIDYGGNITDEEYDKLLLMGQKITINVKMPPIVSLSPKYQLIHIGDSICNTEDAHVFFPLYTLRTKNNGKYRICRTKDLYDTSQIKNIFN